MGSPMSARDYHRRTKHHLHRYAASAGALDWRTQPYPFRRFEAVSTVDLPLGEDSGVLTYDALFGPPIPCSPLNPDSLGRFFYLSLALSAWKEVVDEAGRVVSRWSLRVNPSSGNLHPTEGYALLGAEAGLETGPGLYHYAPDGHLLEQRATGPVPFAVGGFLVGISSIHWREAWKYGERAFRYCQHDVGHALAALALAARYQGWSLELIPGLEVGLADRVLATSEQRGPEREQADCLVWVRTSEGPAPTAADLEGWAAVRKVSGLPNSLSPDHRSWEAIDEVAASCHGAVLPAVPIPVAEGHEDLPDRGKDAAAIIRGRRSAVSMDGHSGLTAEALARLLRRLLPGETPLPLALLPGRAEVSLILFVHRVEGVGPGLYALLRDASHEEAWRGAFREDFRWGRLEGALGEIPFFDLASGEAGGIARQVSCHQDIAAKGAFSLGMVARFGGALEEHGEAWYQRLFWETGLIGQMLYLEAEAAGLRGTGIGCFFDDEVHRLLGLKDDAWQSLYHFTVGGPVDDARLRTAAPYDHLNR